MSRFDIVVFGATGYTGKWVIRQIVGSKLFEGLTWAVAGRSESKLRQVLDELSQITGKNLRAATIIVADVSDVQSLNDMAAQARVIINTVGPYQLYGEPVVKVAVENGASHVDISGEQPFIERMVLKYGLQASEKGLYIVSACGWDSIPADLGVAYLKHHFEGDLNHIESYAAFHKGPAGYALNTGTYESIIGMVEDTVGGRVKNNDRALMPLKTPKSKYKAPFRSKTSLQVTLNTYFRTESVFWTALLVLWLPFFLVLAAIPPTRKLLKDYPDWLTFGLFKKSGPTEEQVSQSHWTTFHVGYGWTDKLPAISTHPTPPNKKVILKVHGPDAAYVGTSGFLVSTALAILKKKNLPSGGVHTTGSAFGKTDIYKYLETFGITFEIIKSTAI